MEDRTVQKIDQEIEAQQIKQWNELPRWKKVLNNLFTFCIIIPACCLFYVLTFCIIYSLLKHFLNPLMDLVSF